MMGCTSHLLNSGQEVIQRQGRGLGAVQDSRAASSHGSWQDQPDLFILLLPFLETDSKPTLALLHPNPILEARQLFAVGLPCLLAQCGFFVCNFVLLGFF